MQGHQRTELTAQCLQVQHPCEIMVAEGDWNVSDRPIGLPGLGKQPMPRAVLPDLLRFEQECVDGGNQQLFVVIVKQEIAVPADQFIGSCHLATSSAPSARRVRVCQRSSQRAAPQARSRPWRRRLSIPQVRSWAQSYALPYTWRDDGN